MKKPVYKKRLLILALGSLLCANSLAQTPPSRSESNGYKELFAAVYKGDIKQVKSLLIRGADLQQRDSVGRSALHIAAFQSHDQMVEELVDLGADINALEDDRYDVITIAAVANDPALMSLAIALGGNPRNVTSPYAGTAMIAAAHLGHVAVVDILINAGAPLDHVNNLGWTALIEAVVLGDGGTQHTAIVASLVKAGADANIADRQGVTPLAHAKQRGYTEMVAILTPVTG